LLPGQLWQREIPKAVQASEVVIVCLSNKVRGRDGFISQEITSALDVAQELPEGTIYIIPLRLEVCEVPERLAKFHWVNWYDEVGYGRLLVALQFRAAELEARSAARETVVHKVDEVPGKETPAAETKAQAPSVPATRPEVVVGVKPIFKPKPSPEVLTISQPFTLDLVRVPAGEFLMGSEPAKDGQAHEDEQPQQPLYLPEFYIGQYPVTNAQYAAFVKAMRHQGHEKWAGGKFPRGGERHPATYVSWYDAVAFCEWVSQASGHLIRLPTEAEWEKGARGAEGQIYPWGDEPPTRELANYDGNEGDTTPVDSYPKGVSLYGAYDMGGNVWEWLQSAYKAYPYKVDDGREDINITLNRVLRGGSWLDDGDNVRAAYRLDLEPDDSNSYLGFRCAVSAPG